MTAMAAGKGPRILATHRSAALVLERARIHVSGGRVVYFSKDDREVKSYNIPHVNLAILFLGQGTSISQEAVRLLSEEGVYLAFTGSGGTPLHFGSLISYQSTSHFRRMLPVYMSSERSLRAARAVMSMRCDRMRSLGKKSVASLFPNVDSSLLDRIATGFKMKLEGVTSIEELLGHEGQYAKQCYAVMASLAGVEVKNGRSAFKRLPGDASTDQDRFRLVNSMIDHGNYLAYGVAGAALWALGIPPHMSIFHGKTRAGGLVFDLADAFKDALVLPLAFHHGFINVGADAEREFRSDIIDMIDDENLLSFAIEVVETLLAAGEADA